MAGSLSVRQRNAAAERKRRFAARQAELSRNNAGATKNLSALGSGIASIPGRVVDYFKTSTPSKVGRDVKGIAKATYDAAVEDPNAFIEDAIFSPLAAIRDFGDVRATARKLRAQGRNAEAEAMEALAGTAVLSAVPILGKPAGVVTRKAIKAATPSLKVTPKSKQLALPAPPKQLALPAPGPGLPPLASKPRGGQFWVDKDLPVFENNTSPEAVARRQAGDVGYRFLSNDDIAAQLGTDAPVPFSPEAFSTQDWLARALAKYYKTDFGSPDDPLRDLAERGLHYDPDMTPEKWKATVDSYLLEDPIGDIMFPPNRAGGMPGAGSNMRGGALSAMPWLAKQPVTDKVYGIGGGGLDLEHFADEFANALNPEASGLPFDLAVRPESLDRMSFAAAAERVGRINQFRAKEMERAGLSNLDSPAVQTFKEYADDNPMGLRWTELKAPSEESGLFKIVPAEEQGVPFHYVEDTATGERTPIGGTREDALRQAQEMYGRDPLQDALKYEGDTMGHCVGGYCPDVMSGKSRIFSLRDAKGEPHVTVETRPHRVSGYYDLPEDDQDIINNTAWDQILKLNQPNHWDAEGNISFEGEDALNQIRDTIAREEYAPAIPFPDEIVQIKGKQNAKPKDDYLPFVQDFVKSQQWGNIGDMQNTGLVRLPDGRVITPQQAEEVISAIPETTEMTRAFASREMVPMRRVYDPTGLDRLDPEEWRAISQYFEGYAIGGRVSADRCFSRHPMSVKR